MGAAKVETGQRQLEKWEGPEGGRHYLLSDSRGIHSHLWQKRREPIYLTPPALLLNAWGGGSGCGWFLGLLPPASPAQCQALGARC